MRGVEGGQVADGPGGRLPRTFPVAEGVTGIDLRFLGQPQRIASYAIRGPGGRFALVETGPESTLEELKAGLREAGLELGGLQAVLLTHIHLDHAGAAGALAREAGCPVYVHEVGLPHLVDPSRLWRSASRLYGDEMERLWKGVTPVPPERLRPIGQEARIEVAGRRLLARYAPGHASHHVIYLLDGEVLFTGDAAGVRLPGTGFVQPPTPPPDLHLEQWDQSISVMLGLSPKRLALAHFGVYQGDVGAHLEALRQRLRRWGELLRAWVQEGLSEEEATARFVAAVREELAAEGSDPSAPAAYAVVAPADQCALGYLRYWRKFKPGP